MMVERESSVCPTCGVRSLATDPREPFDGYHTMAELYEHRIRLWISFCLEVTKHDLEYFMPDHESSTCWRSRLHSDGSGFDGWFLLGMNREPGKQITYHLPECFWAECGFAATLERAPEFDGHTAGDVLQRLAAINDWPRSR